MARATFFKAPLGLPLGLPDCPEVNLSRRFGQPNAIGEGLCPSFCRIGAAVGYYADRFGRHRVEGTAVYEELDFIWLMGAVSID